MQLRSDKSWDKCRHLRQKHIWHIKCFERVFFMSDDWMSNETYMVANLASKATSKSENLQNLQPHVAESTSSCIHTHNFCGTTNQGTYQPTIWSTDQPTDWPMINQPTNQPTNQLTERAIELLVAINKKTYMYTVSSFLIIPVTPVIS